MLHNLAQHISLPSSLPLVARTISTSAKNIGLTHSGGSLVSLSATSSPVSLLNNPAFHAAFQGMSEIGIAGIIGMICVYKSYVTPDTIRALSKTCYTILLPMFLSTSIMKTVATYGLSSSTFVVPCLAIAHCFTMFVLSKNCILPAFKIPYNTDAGRSTAVCCSFGNSAVLPLTFAEALFRSSAIFSQCVGHVSTYLMGWSPFFWGFARRKLIGSNEDGQQDKFGRLRQLIPPPVFGILIGMITIISPLGKLFIASNTLGSQTRQPPLSIVYNTIQNFGRAANPLSLLVMTSSLGVGIGLSKSSTEDDLYDYAGLNKDSVNISIWRRLACVSVARFAISPALMVLFLKFLKKCNCIPSPSANPALWFILMLQASTPSAQNTVLMLQAADKSIEASKMAEFLFFVYATSMIPVIAIATKTLSVLNLAP